MVSKHPSKHDLVTAYERGCPRAAYESMIDKTPPGLALRRIFVEGNAVDTLARDSIFSDGVTVTTPDVGQAAAETSALMADDSVVRINQATFVAPGGESTRLDAIVRSGEKWSHEEVKSGTDAKDKYVYDALVSTDRAKRAGLDVDEVRLVTVNSNWRLGDPPEALFQYTDITDRIQDPEMVGLLSRTYAALQNGKVPAASLVPGCWKCEYFPSCFGEIEYPITLLKRLGEARILALSQQGVVDIRNIPAVFDLTNGQRETINSALNGQEHVNRDLLEESLGGLDEPVRHLDFEWSGFAVPLHTDVAPWGAVTTQFSIHLEAQDGPEHTEYLSEAVGDGRRELAKRMIQELGEEGSIVVYSIGAEGGRIRDMASWFPDLADQLVAIENRLFDLEPLVKKCLIYPQFFGKSSLKVVLPVIVPGFGYDDLEVTGGEDALGAMNLMMRGQIPAERVPELRKQLLRYCERDTEATVRILQALREKVAGGGE